MAHITEDQLHALVARGMVPQSEVDRIQQSRKLARKAERLREDAAAAALTRVRLAEPVEFTIPMDLFTENRIRAMHPLRCGAHIKEQRAVVRNAWRLHFRATVPELPVVVTFIRRARKMDAHDSLRAAFKHVTDEVTLMLGLRNDDTPHVTWEYDQAPRGGSTANAITIRVEARP